MIISLSPDPPLGSFLTLRSNLLGSDLLEPAADDDKTLEGELEDSVEDQDIFLHKDSNEVLGGGLHFAASAAKIDIISETKR